MTPVAIPLARLAQQIVGLSDSLGRRVTLDFTRLIDRTGHLPLAAPGGLVSPNGSCRLVQAQDGWIALNLARPDDAGLVPAWLGCEAGADPWPAIVAEARGRPWSELVAAGRLLGLPVAGVGEVSAQRTEAPLVTMGESGRRHGGAPVVVDLSSLWAGPLCGAVLADAGAAVTKVESTGRPDPSRSSTPRFYYRLNAAKAELKLDFTNEGHVRHLREMMLAADVVITSARPRAFDQLGLSPAALFAARPHLTWVAISGYGWFGEGADRVAFGDDAAAAGDLVTWTPQGPRFMGDALGDPLTGMAAALGALQGLAQGGGVMVDAAMARTAAGAAAELGLRKVA